MGEKIRYTPSPLEGRVGKTKTINGKPQMTFRMSGDKLNQEILDTA